MKTPISYYGGKQQMVPVLLELEPEHDGYSESFFGGGAYLFAKAPKKIEVINDKNQEVINFYRVAKNDFLKLKALVDETLHSRELYQDALHIYARPTMFNDVKRAWAFWILCNQGFGSKIGTWGYDRHDNSLAKKLGNAKIRFTTELEDRLSHVQVECTDANQVIKSRDREGMFHYVDPPYFNSDCGHYDGYTLEDFRNLLETLSKLDGKFLLSSYDSPILKEWVKSQGWKQQFFQQTVSVNGKGKRKPKVEVLTANYIL